MRDLQGGRKFTLVYGQHNMDDGHTQVLVEFDADKSAVLDVDQPILVAALVDSTHAEFRVYLQVTCRISFTWLTLLLSRFPCLFSLPSTTLTWPHSGPFFVPPQHGDSDSPTGVGYRAAKMPANAVPSQCQDGVIEIGDEAVVLSDVKIRSRLIEDVTEVSLEALGSCIRLSCFGPREEAASLLAPPSARRLWASDVFE